MRSHSGVEPAGLATPAVAPSRWIGADDLFALGLTLLLAAMAPLWCVMYPPDSWPGYAHVALWVAAVTAMGSMAARAFSHGLTLETLAHPVFTVSAVSVAALAGVHFPVAAWPMAVVAPVLVVGMIGGACCLKALWWGVADVFRQRL